MVRNVANWISEGDVDLVLGQICQGGGADCPPSKTYRTGIYINLKLTDESLCIISVL